MEASRRADLAAMHTRALLVRSGLAQDEAERVIAMLKRDTSAERFDELAAQLGLVRRDLEEMRLAHQEQSGVIERRDVLVAIATGVASSGLYDLLKGIASEIAAEMPGRGETSSYAPTKSRSRKSQQIVQVNWIGGRMPTEFDQRSEALLRRALEINRQHHSRPNAATALYLDGCAMFLDANRHHQQAEKERREIVKVAERVHGHLHEATGAALANLGISLFAEKRHTESSRYLARALTVMMATVGKTNVSTAAVIYACYVCFEAEGRLKGKAIPKQFMDVLPDLRELADQMMTAKAITLTMAAALEVSRNLKNLPQFRAARLRSTGR